VQILRTGGEHLAAWRRRECRVLFAVAGAGAVSVASASFLAHPLVGALMALSILPVALKLHARLARIGKGIHGETLVTELLQRLPDEYFLVNDIVLPGHRGNVDHVLVGPCGVVVIETKHYEGVIKVFRKRWFVNGSPSRSISGQVNRNAVAVRDLLIRKHPDLASSVLRFVETIVVFTNPQCRLRINGPNTTVVRYSELLGVMLAKAGRKRVPAGVVARLAETLKGIHGTRPGLRPLAGIK
jgi:hypothetical protein